VIVDNLDGFRTGIRPNEADPVLVIDPDAVVTAPISLQRLKPVSRRNPEIDQDACGIQRIQLLPSLPPPLPEQGFPSRLCTAPKEEIFGRPVIEASEHDT
jgi:hypothetical protein